MGLNQIAQLKIELFKTVLSIVRISLPSVKRTAAVASTSFFEVVISSNLNHNRFDHEADVVMNAANKIAIVLSKTAATDARENSNAQQSSTAFFNVLSFSTKITFSIAGISLTYTNK